MARQVHHKCGCTPEYLQCIGNVPISCQIATYSHLIWLILYESYNDSSLNIRKILLLRRMSVIYTKWHFAWIHFWEKTLLCPAANVCCLAERIRPRQVWFNMENIITDIQSKEQEIRHQCGLRQLLILLTLGLISYLDNTHVIQSMTHILGVIWVILYELWYREVTNKEVPDYDLNKMLSDIGGAAGLFLGIRLVIFNMSHIQYMSHILKMIKVF